MRAATRQLVALLLALTGPGCARDTPEQVRSEPPTAVEPVPRAVLESFRGEVSVKRAAGDAWTSAGEAMKLYENDTVRTARGASAELRFGTGSVLSVGEDALIGIPEARPRPGVDPSDVTVLKGRIDAQLADTDNQSLVVTTPAAAVRAGREIVFQ